MKKYSYQGIQLYKRVASQFIGVIGILFFTIFGLVLLSGVTSVGNGKSILNDPKITLICFSVWSLLIAWSIGSIFLNFLPNIWTTEKGLQISAFIFLRIQILWSDIVDIGVGMPPKGYVLVRTHKITPFHRLYGWLYSRSFYPSFLIGNDITDRDDLINEIRLRIN